jgi:hypothetical protein
MSLKKKIQNKVKEILKNKKIKDYELEIDCNGRLIFITINDITSKIEFKFEDFMILTNFFNIWGIYLEDEISRIITLKKWVVCLKNDCCIKQINFCDGVQMEYDYDGLINGFSIITCSTGIKQFEKINCDHIAICEKDAKAKICANNSSQTVGQFISRLGINKSSRRAGSGTPTVPISSNIYCFVVDTGIQSNHSDLRVNTTISRNFTTRNQGAWNDDNGHGTHVAGIISALDNTRGIVGNSPNVNIVAIKVLNRSGSGSFTNIISSLSYINNWKNNNPTAKVIVNMSLGGNFYQPLNTAIQNLISNGINVCVAAGNNSSNASEFSPASAPNAITVGSYNGSTNVLSSFSNFGTTVDILAPGNNIDSTWIPNTYRVLSGTSMATPMVVGIVANLINLNPNLTPLEIRNKLIADSSILNPINNDGSTGSNPRITLSTNANNAGTTNVGVYGGQY